MNKKDVRKNKLFLIFLEYFSFHVRFQLTEMPCVLRIPALRRVSANFKDFNGL
jgi:hypothetical protein